MLSNELLAFCGFLVTVFGLAIGSRSLVDRESVRRLSKDIREAKKLLDETDYLVKLERARADYFLLFVPAVLKSASDERLSSTLKVNDCTDDLSSHLEVSKARIIALYYALEDKNNLQVLLSEIVSGLDEKRFCETLDSLMAYCLDSHDFVDSFTAALGYARSLNFFQPDDCKDTAECKKYFDEQFRQNFNIYYLR